MRIYGADPKWVLEAAGNKVPDFVIDIINSLLMEVAKNSSGTPCRLSLAKQLVMASLHKAALEKGIDYDKRWLNFPIYYLRDWDIELPHDEYGYYYFAPKGLTV